MAKAKIAGKKVKRPRHAERFGVFIAKPHHWAGQRSMVIPGVFMSRSEAQAEIEVYEKASDAAPRMVRKLRKGEL